MKKKKKMPGNAVIKTVSVLLVIFGGLTFAAAAFIIFEIVKGKMEPDLAPAAVFVIPSALCLTMGISQLISMKKKKRNLIGLTAGLLTLTALIVFMATGVTKLLSEGVELVFILVVVFSPAIIITIIYIKAVMKEFGPV